MIRRLTSSSSIPLAHVGRPGDTPGVRRALPIPIKGEICGSASAWPDFAADLCKADRRRIGRPATAGLLRERRRLRRKPLAKFGNTNFLTWGCGMRGSRLVGAFALAFTASGCTVGPDYQKPVFRLPTGFWPSDQSVERSGPAPADLPQWWRSLRDRQLEFAGGSRTCSRSRSGSRVGPDPGSASRTGGDRRQALPEGGATSGAAYGTGNNETTAAVPPPLRAGENTTEFRKSPVRGRGHGHLGSPSVRSDPP